MTTTSVLEARTQRAEKTIKELALGSPSDESADSTQVEQEPLTEAPPAKKPMGRPKKILEAAPTNGDDPYTPPQDKKKSPTEDFFSYLQKITPEEWSSSKTSGLYIYRESPKGNVRINDEPLHRAVTLQELREDYLPKFGPGTYRLQFTTGLKHLTTCGERVTFDGQATSLGGASVGAFTGGLAGNDFSGISRAFESISDISRDAAKAAVEVVKSAQVENNKAPDIAGIITAITALLPKQDNTFLVTLLENQRQEAERRAERAEREGKDRAERAEKEAKDREERSEKFFSVIQSQQDKFYTMLLAEKEKKQEDTYGGMDLVKGLFKVFLEERVESAANPVPNNAIGLIATALDKLSPALASLAPAIGMKLSGQQMPPVHIAAPLHPAPGSDGEGRVTPGPGVINTETLLIDLMNRLGLYLSTHDPRDYQLNHWVDVVFEEYGPVASVIQQLPKERIMEVLKTSPIGVQLLSIQNSQLFLDALIDAIKAPEETSTEGDTLAEAIPTEAQVIPAKAKGKKQEVS